ncbi:MAG: non-ribosomal peptide synthetase module, partial [Gammaproteobacteria bacterium]|nr:non-ribosomal peptide synthetase module [Gammaproteobacteria bacterium]
QDSAPQVVLTYVPEARGTHGEWLSQLSDRVPVIDLETHSSAGLAHLESNPDPQSVGLRPTHLAYVIYTSGSTGMPKGVMVEHRNLVHSTDARRVVYGSPGRFMLLSPLGFDSSVAGIFGTLIGGGTLLIATQDSVRDPQRLAGDLSRLEATDLLCVPSLYRAVLALPEVCARNRTLRRVIVAGETCPPTLISDSARLIPDAVVFNEYGPTEGTVWATVFECRSADRLATVPIGRPIPNTSIYILDRDRQPVPIGVVGEIYIGGAGVARGYLNREDLTAERFVEDSFCVQPGQRMYRTGDQGRWRADGLIEFVGRNDEQVKIRGYRIELGEIEARLRECAGVQEAVVLAREDSPGDKRLVAYYTVSTTESSTPTEAARVLRAHMMTGLPEYMVPAAYVRLKSWPLTANGKLDRKALPAPEAEAYAVREYEEPRGEIERQLAQVWSEVLKLERVGRHDNFFELGGNSLLATEAVARIRGVLGVNVSMRDLYYCQTIANFAESVAGNVFSADAERDLPWGDRPALISLSHSQRRIWFMCQLDPDTLAYNSQATIALEGALEVAALRDSFNDLIRRHEILRTTFEETSDELVQVIHPFQYQDVPLHDFADLEPQRRDARLQELIANRARHKFELGRLPLICWDLVRLAPRSHVLIHVEHHLVHDGYSFNIIVSELTRAYRRRVSERGSLEEFAAPNFQYADFAAWEGRWMQTAGALRQLEYWRRQLENCPATLSLPIRQGPLEAGEPKSAPIRFDLPLGLSRKLRAFSATRGTTLYVSMLTAFAILLGRYSGQTDVPIGTGIANRRHPHSEGVLGMFVNTVVLRCDTSGAPTIAELLARAKDVVLEASEHQEFPFEKIVESVNPERLFGVHPFFQCMFSFHDSRFSGVAMPGLELSVREALATGEAKFDVNIIVIPRDKSRRLIDADADQDGICIVWDYNRERLEDATAERMTRHYVRVLSEMVADAGQSVERVPLLDEQERHQLLVEWNATAAEYPREKCIHELFEEQVERTPEAVALVYEGQQLTYAQLN